MRLIFTFILMLCSGMVDAQNIIKKCKTCGKPISQCQYKGTHVASSSVSPSPQKKKKSCKKNATNFSGSSNVIAFKSKSFLGG